jgi:ABC-2 type transport system permease protein
MGLIFGSLFRADFTVLVRSARTVVLNLAVPLIVLIIFSLHTGQGAGASAGLTSAGFDVGLALTYGLMSSSLIGYSVAIAKDRDAGVFQRLRITPAPSWAIMASRILVQIVVNVIMTIIVIVVGVIIDHLTLTVVQYLLVALVSIIGGIMFLAIAQAVVGLVRSATAVNAIGRVLYIVFLLLGLLGSSGLLGDTVQSISDWTPGGAMINLYASALSLTSWSSGQTAAVIAAVIYIVVGAFIGIRWFRWDSR